MNKIGAPLRPCKRAACGQLFTPRARKVKGRVLVSEFCSWLCATSWVHDQNRGKPMAGALAANRALRRAKRAQYWFERFGHLTQREIDIAAHAEAMGYDRGYHTAYARPTARRRTAS